MSEVKRFDHVNHAHVDDCEHIENPGGAWVKASDYDALAAEAQALREEVAELRRDKARLDAIEDNCWDVRYGSSSNADAGDSSISIEIVGRYQGVPRDLRGAPPQLLQWLIRSGKPVMCFGVTSCGQPKHPLMLGYDTPLTAWPS